MQSAALPPVRKTIEVGTTADHAFRVFTADMQKWWPPPCEGGEERTNMVVEPRVGGRWFEQIKGGGDRQLGRVLAWEPHSRLLLTWQLRLKEKTFDPNLETEIEITFTPTAPAKTLVAVEHRKLERFGLEAEQAYQAFNSPNAWVGILEAFRAAF
jgi:uncharacterized protein YndB with AHSA1/START domain